MKRAATVAILLALAAPATAEPGDVVYVKDGVLTRQPVLVKGEAVALATLESALAKVDRVEVSPDGKTLVVGAGRVLRWLDLEAPAPVPRALVCAGHVTLGSRLSCDVGTGYTLVADLRAGVLRVVDAVPAGARTVGNALVHSAGDALWAHDLATDELRQLAEHAPPAHLLVAPDGTRAVGVYGTGDDAAIYTFRLDGTGVRRKLSRDAVPLAWSADSQWILAQQGSRACIVRAVGGQYKCWKRYRALALAPDGSWALVARDRDDSDLVDLYRAELAGPDADRPTPVVEGARPAAAWLP